MRRIFNRVFICFCFILFLFSCCLISVFLCIFLSICVRIPLFCWILENNEPSLWEAKSSIAEKWHQHKRTQFLQKQCRILLPLNKTNNAIHFVLSYSIFLFFFALWSEIYIFSAIVIVFTSLSFVWWINGCFPLSVFRVSCNVLLVFLFSVVFFYSDNNLYNSSTYDVVYILWNVDIREEYVKLTKENPRKKEIFCCMKMHESWFLVLFISLRKLFWKQFCRISLFVST